MKMTLEEQKNRILEMNQIFSSGLNQDINERGRPDPYKEALKVLKLRINKIIKQYGIPAQKYESSSVRGFRRPDGKGFSHYENAVLFNRVSPETVAEIARKVQEDGIETRYNHPGDTFFTYKQPNWRDFE